MKQLWIAVVIKQDVSTTGCNDYNAQLAR